MTDAHRGHLCAGLSSLEEIVRDMTEIGSKGRSPTNGQRLTPLPPQVWSEIETPLERAVGRLRETMRLLAPDALAERDRAEEPSGTLFRLAILLRHAEEEIVDGLDPAQMERKFGALSADERLVLGELRAGLRADLAEVRRAMETDRTP